MMKAHDARQAMKGFALIATISVLLLLTLVAVAFLSLSALTVKTSRFEWAQEEARANARLGLMIAIGELQRDLGPDQRIAVSASILDSDPDTIDIDGVKNQHWTGVMTSVYEQNRNGSPYTRDMSAGGLADARNGTDYRARDFILNYIVSGNEGGQDGMSSSREFQNAVTEDLVVGENAVELVSRGSTNDPNSFVRAKTMLTEKEQLTASGARQFRPNGRYAFWVGSNNVKANIGRPDSHGNTAVRENGDGIWRMLHPQDAEPFVIDGIEEGQRNRDSRVLTSKTLTAVSESNREGVLRNYHAMTGLSSSVLCNVRDGGLKKNLSVFLHNSDGDSPMDIDSIGGGEKTHYIGISAEDRLIGPPNEEYAAIRDEDYEESEYQDIAPTFELLWRWAQLADEFDFGESLTGIRPQKTAPASRPGSGDFNGAENMGWDNGAPLVLRDSINNSRTSNVYDQEVGEAADPRNLSDVKITPVIVEACVYYNLATYPVGSGSEQEHALRLCLYPRVGLWNPYNVDMQLDRDMVLQLFLNGKKRVSFNGEGEEFTREIYYGGRRTDQLPDDPNRRVGIFDSQYGGQVYFLLPSVTIPAGQTLIFSMGGTPRELDPQFFAGNTLQARDAPSAGSYLYKDYLWSDLSNASGLRQAGTRRQHANDPGTDTNSELMRVRPTSFRENPGSLDTHGADNYMFMLKYLENGATRFADGNRDPDPVWVSEPTLIYASVSLQAGGGDEFPVEWDADFSHQVISLSGVNDHVDDGDEPHPFTRDGFRVRWLEETESNIAGGPNNDLLLQSSALGNWNLRASYICRNPFDNVSTTTPYFHGIYTRDNPSEDVSWSNLSPRLVDGFQTGFPFGEASFGVDSVIAFELPTREVGIPSLAYLRHLQLSEFVWHPSYSIGSSIADPRVKRTGTVPNETDLDMDVHGWNSNNLAIDYWARLLRNVTFGLCYDNHLIFDMTYEVNHNLWSDFFLTGGTPNQVANFSEDPVGNPLKNGNLRLWDSSGDPASDLNDFFRSAGRLMMDGGFDVHSTNKEAWKAYLSSGRDLQYASTERTPFPRTLFPKGEENERAEYSTKVFTGFRSLSDTEIDSLAEAMVREVKLRAPFFGMSDFINRRLAEDETGRNGAIEAALEKSLPNRGQNSRFPIDDTTLGSDSRFIAQTARNNDSPVVDDNTRLDHQLKPASTGYGTPGYITQGDILQAVGSGLVSRSDTFTVRAYGESVDVNGNVQARAWCEATVQRTPEPMAPDDETGLNPREPEGNEVDFGRRFQIVSFRWLNADEV